MSDNPSEEQAKKAGLNLFHLLGQLMLSPDPGVAKRATAARSDLSRALDALFTKENN